MPFSLVEVCGRFRGTQCYHPGSKSKPIKQSLLFGWLVALPWRWKQYVSLKPRQTSTRLHGFRCQKIRLFIVTDVRAPNVTRGFLFRWHLLQKYSGQITHCSSKRSVLWSHWNETLECHVVYLPTFLENALYMPNPIFTVGFALCSSVYVGQLQLRNGSV
jgi:hypothetical protein